MNTTPPPILGIDVSKHEHLYMAHYDHVHHLRRSERPGESLYLR